LTRRFLVALSVMALLVGLPLGALAAWWGVQAASALAGAENPYQAICRLPTDDGRLLAEQFDLRRRIAALEGEIATRLGMCPICQAAAAHVAVVIDTSPSMRWPAAMDAAAEAAAMVRIVDEAGPILEPPAQNKLLAAWNAVPPASNRMAEARKVALALLGALPTLASIDLLSFTRFDAARVEATQCHVAPLGRFAPGDQPKLKAALEGLTPDASGTPLAEAVSAAAATLRGRPAGTSGLVLVVTDGTETCHGDPCAAVAAALAADPKLDIAIIDIAHNTGLACLANNDRVHLVAPDRGGIAAVVKVLAERLHPVAGPACLPPPASRSPTETP
jgi:hypothetical protein